MSASLYIVVEGEDPGYDTFVNGRMLAQTEDTLSRLAARLGVTPLLDFFSADKNSLALLELEGIELPLKFSSRLTTQWYTPESGLRTVRTLLEYLHDDAEYLGADTGSVTAELEEYAAVLKKTAARGLRWHLAVSWR